MAVFALLESTNIISRKFCVTVKSWHFQTLWKVAKKIPHSVKITDFSWNQPFNNLQKIKWFHVKSELQKNCKVKIKTKTQSRFYGKIHIFPVILLISRKIFELDCVLYVKCFHETFPDFSRDFPNFYVISRFFLTGG